MSAGRLKKTSVQLPPEVVRDLKGRAGLTMSEAIRLAVERAHYVATLDSEEIAGLADEYAPILSPALDGLKYHDFRLAARALPSIVEGFIRESPGATFHYEGGDGHALDPLVLVEKLRGLGPLGRIGVMDCTIARRKLREDDLGALSRQSRRKTNRASAA